MKQWSASNERGLRHSIIKIIFIPCTHFTHRFSSIRFHYFNDRRYTRCFKVPYEISCFRKVKFTSGVKDKASKWTARNKRNLGSEWNKIKFQIEIEFSFASRFVHSAYMNAIHSLISLQLFAIVLSCSYELFFMF